MNIPRGDSRKFEALQVLAAFLGWNEDQKEIAGLRPGTSNGSRVASMASIPISPSAIRRSSTFDFDSLSPERESIKDLWVQFLEQESQGVSDVKPQPES